MANVQRSSRSTAWDRFITQSAFRAGFDDVRMGVGFRPAYDRRSEVWQWYYEYGRLFAASSFSRRWSRIPTKRRDVSGALIQACANARRALDIPPIAVAA
jgi:hypothetical protein